MLGHDRSRERGAASLETVAMTIVAALLAAAVVVAATPQGKILGETFSYAVCQVVTAGQGPCEAPSTSPEAHKPKDPCVLTQEGVERNQKVSVLIVTTSDGRRIEIQKLSNGEYRVTVTDTGGAGVEVGVGGGLTVTVNDNTYGGSATAQASATLDIKGGEVYYADQDGINDLLDALTQDQVKDTVAGDGGPIRWAVDGLSHLTGVADNDLPDPDEIYAEGGISLNASAEATSLYANAQAGVSATQALGTRTNRDGTTTVYLKTTVSGKAGLQSLGLDPDGDPELQGARLEGKIDVVNAVTFDSEGNLVRVQATGIGNYESKGLAAALFNGDPDAGISGNTDNGYTVYQASLNIEDDYDRQVAAQHLLALGVGSLGPWTNPLLNTDPSDAYGNFFEVAGERGTVTKLDYDADSNTVFGVDATAKLGVELGVSASVKTDSLAINDAQYWDGTQWVDWEECSV
jgi:hypothetical protein